MKKLFLTIIIASLFISGGPGLALEGACVTEFPTTSFIFSRRGSHIVVDLIHHNGTDFAPLHSGILVPHDLTTMQKRAQLVHSLGTSFSFIFSADKCQMPEPLLMECRDWNAPTQEINGHSVQLQLVMTTLVQTRSTVGKFDHTELSALLEVDGAPLWVHMRYSPGECLLQP
ncbi:MAG: hypothetical protein N2578_10010 [Bdellovibrionaceae bacterium]|nr:hypothetical protein [Pseudobdellovibrionaceae bacterium]